MEQACCDLRPDICIALLQPSFKRMLGPGREVEAKLATKRVLLTDPFGYSSEISLLPFIYYFIVEPLYSPGSVACGRTGGEADLYRRLY